MCTPRDTWFVWLTIPNSSSIGSAILARLMSNFPYTLHCPALFHPKFAHYSEWSGLPSNIWFFSPTRLTIPNGTSKESAVFPEYTHSLPTGKTSICQYTKNLVSHVIRHYGKILFTIWAAGVRAQRRSCQGYKSRKSPTDKPFDQTDKNWTGVRLVTVCYKWHCLLITATAAVKCFMGRSFKLQRYKEAGVSAGKSNYIVMICRHAVSEKVG